MTAPDQSTWIHKLEPAAAQAFAPADATEGPLSGLTVAIKDNIDLAGVPTTAGCPDYAFTPTQSAFVMDALIAAGVLPAGKTNMDQFATGLVGVRSPYGIAQHPIDSAYIPGGSSSGSAVAVARGQADIALGTDTAGSGRVPAAFNGLFGVKPTRGLLSTSGVVPACRSLDCVSIFARDAATARKALNAAAVYDPDDPYARPFTAPDKPFPKRPRIGVPMAAQLKFFSNEDYAACFAAARESLAEHADLVEINAAPFFDAANLLYGGPWVAERTAAIESFLADKPDSLHPVTRAIIDGGHRYKAVDTFKAMYELEALRKRANAAWDSIDAMLTPTAGTHYTIAEVEADPVQTNTNLGTYTNFMNLLDLCALAVPAGQTPAGMPFGVTLCAPAFRDYDLLDIAAAWHGEEGSSEPVQEMVSVAVCGAHLEGGPLHHQLTDRGGRLKIRTRSAACYKLYALAAPEGSVAKPGLVRDPAGASIEVEVWDLPLAHYGSFVAGIPYPLGIGSMELEDGSWVQGFACESEGLAGAEDISDLGGWRAYLARQT